ncbi:FliM/FliN family flagellar motor switch protein [Roseateles violae]|uniref:Flagellar motor switch protein FliN n=1 Tax=Roseateles violae TaxID=3058042 RepID=A0ABT8DTQ3_9BURK|nr:FliM/FliN family flagellar motor switch protein [Pelomonas sp. PFR6]MDN3921577.1 FliM/FliN family flagellar motor switch protein [Pelomonas sp. PFR6]
MTMMNDANALEALLADLPAQDVQEVAPPPAAPTRDLPKLMRKIPVTLTLEVGEARVSLQDLLAIGADSVIELNTLAGEPLTLKANGTTIGRAEVVVSGENYGLKVIEIAGLDLDSLAP